MRLPVTSNLNLKIILILVLFQCWWSAMAADFVSTAQSSPSWIDFRARSSDMGGAPLVNDRIVGGSEVGVGEFPFLVSLQRRGRHFCGGSLLTPNWILTAAHCSVFPPSDCVVVAGAHDIALLNGTTAQAQGVLKMVVHPQYNPETHENDVALWLTKSRFKLDGTVAPVNLIKSTSNRCAGPSEVTAVGWGKLTEGASAISMVPEKANLAIDDPATCAAVYQKLRVAITGSMLCAGGDGVKDACQGDSGGPLLCHVNCDPQTTISQCGIGTVTAHTIYCKLPLQDLAFGAGCGRQGVPGVYTNLLSFNDFIISTVST